MTNRLTINARYTIAVVFMLLFIFSDLLFDFVLSFGASDIIAFCFTLLSAIIVFVCNGKIKNDEIKNKYYKTTEFIKSNFDNFQVIFSILDIVCGLISIFSSYFFLACAFKVVRIFYIPTKILVVINKEKSLLKPIVKFSFFWTSIRIIEKKGGTMAKFIQSNKRTLVLGLLISAFLAVATYFALPRFVALVNWQLYAICAGVFVLAYVAVFFVGFDTAEGLALRYAKKALPEEKFNELMNVYNNAKAEVDRVAEQEKLNKKAEVEAGKLLKEEKKEEAKAKAKEEASKIDVEKEKFDRLVQEKLAEMKNKQ